MSTPTASSYQLPDTPYNFVDEDKIQTLVYCFYDRVMQDPALQLVFDNYIPTDDWPAHLETMCDFWSNVLLRTHRYQGRPMPAHFKINELCPGHFTDWLTLFGKTCYDIFNAEIAEAIYRRAELIADSFKQGLKYAGRPGF